MKLEKYQKEHSAIICSWIKDEKSLYQWSADRIGKFPLSDNDLNENYAKLPSIKLPFYDIFYKPYPSMAYICFFYI